MRNDKLHGADFSSLRDIAEVLLWYGDDLAADTIYAAIELRDGLTGVGAGNIVPLFPPDAA